MEFAKAFLAESLFSLAVHELGHVVAALMLGLRVKRVGMNFYGPYIIRETGTPMQDAIVCAVGPTVNLVIAAATCTTYPAFGLINLVLGVSNFLPLPKSDGTRMLRALARLRH